MYNYHNPFSLTGKTILVTGASSGIGRETAIECSKMGAKIIVTARNKERLSDTLANLCGLGHTDIIADLTDEEELKTLISGLPSLDGVVLCAGKTSVCPVQFSSLDGMKDVFDINYFYTVETVRLLFKNKKLNRNSSVVLIDSIGGITRIDTGKSIYGASKAALNSFMKFCALEFSKRQVRVNCICPGRVETPLIQNDQITEDQITEDKKNIRWDVMDYPKRSLMEWCIY